MAAGTKTAVATETAKFMPDWILTTSYALHMIATVLWVGGLVFQGLFLLPLLTRDAHDTKSLTNLSLLQNRFQPIAWLSLAILFGTGLTQMAAHPQYEGFLAIQNRWSIAIFMKHLTILPMLAITTFHSFVLHPRLERVLLKSKNTASEGGTADPFQNEKRMVLLNTLLSVVVLILTAVARTS